MNTLGDRVKYAREVLRKISQAELAAEVGISQVSLAYVESGTTKNPRNIERFAKALSVSKEWLLVGGDDPALSMGVSSPLDKIKQELAETNQKLVDTQQEIRTLRLTVNKLLLKD